MSSPAASLAAPPRFSATIRWIAVVWFVVWFPAYWHAWGLANFLHLCDLAVVLTCIGFWTGSPLLISTQALSSLVIDAAWILEAGWRVVAGRPLIGGTEYLFDPHVALWIRLLSLFHVALPPLLLWALSRTGYDRRALAYQSGIAVVALVAARFTNPAANINYAFTDPFWHRVWGPAPLHISLTFLGLFIAVYLPTHFVLKVIYPSPSNRASQ